MVLILGMSATKKPHIVFGVWIYVYTYEYVNVCASFILNNSIKTIT